jgi:hypothetical protein
VGVGEYGTGGLGGVSVSVREGVAMGDDVEILAVGTAGSAGVVGRLVTVGGVDAGGVSVQLERMRHTVTNTTKKVPGVFLLFFIQFSCNAPVG